MTQQKQRMEKEIDDLVVAQADDPTAWEEEADVRPRRWKVNPARLGLAAKFYVLSALHRLAPTPRLLSATVKTWTSRSSTKRAKRRPWM